MYEMNSYVVCMGEIRNSYRMLVREPATFRIHRYGCKGIN